MIICHCLNIGTKDIEDLVEKNVDTTVDDVYTSFQQGSKHIPCDCCPEEITKLIKELGDKL